MQYILLTILRKVVVGCSICNCMIPSMLFLSKADTNISFSCPYPIFCQGLNPSQLEHDLLE